MTHDPTGSYPERVLRFCPRCGGSELDFSSLNAFTCRNCHNPLYLNVAAAVAAIIERDDGTFLLARRNHDPARGLLDVPGGFLEPLESAERALRREIQEELGLDLDDLVLFGTFPNRYVFKGLTYFTCDIVFRSAPRSFDAMRLSDEIAEVVFVRPGDVAIEDLAFESVRAIVEGYRRFIESDR
jgi:NAD+ diphosphatase